MEISQLFKKLESNKYGYSDNIKKYLSEKYNDFCNDIIEVTTTKKITDPIKSYFDDIKKIGLTILETIDAYLYGSPSTAYVIFSDIMDELYDKLETFNYKRDIKTANRKLYRVRTDDKNEINSKIKMFHIPFNERFMVSNQRYSINGLPCLYLGSSIYDCWVEINKENINIIKVSKFRIKNYPNILDLSMEYRIEDETKEIIDNEGYYFNWIREVIIIKIFLYQLILACSIRSIPNVNFNEAYIIPQLLLEWIRNNKDIDGVEYISTHYTDKNKPANDFINYVFPPKVINDEGHCKHLLDLFDYSEPITIVLNDVSDYYDYLKKKENDFK